MKEFTEQLNDIIAPVTRAYSEPQIIEVELKGADIHENMAFVTVKVKVRRRPGVPVEDLGFSSEPLVH